MDEGDTVTITLSLSGTNNDLGVGVATPEGTATLAVDYGADRLGPFILESANSFTESQSIPITDDGLPEPDETIIIPVLMRSNGIPRPNTVGPVTITIRANDAPVFSIAVDESARDEGQTAVFTVTLGDTAPTGAATVDWAVSGTGITAGDYTVSGAGSGNRGTLSFTELGSQTLNFAIAADGLREDAEMLTVTLSNPSSGAVIGTASATTTIAESDQPHAHSFVFTSPAAAITEGAAATTYTVTRTGPDITGSITVTWAYAASTPAPVAADFHNDTLPAGGTLEFTGMETSETFTVRTKEDTLNEAGERFTLTLSIASAHEAAANAEGGAGVPAAHTVTITDDDPITATISGNATADEGDTGVTGVTVALTGGEHTAPVVIRYDGDDATGMLSIPVGTTSDTLTLAATDDTVSEGQDTITIDMNSLTATSAGTVTVAGSATLTINADSDDDITVTVTAPASANTGQAAEFAVRMSNAAAAAVTVDFTVALTVDGTDLSSRVTATPANSLSIPAGRTSGVISVAIPADVNVAQSGSLTVTLTDATAATGGGTADVSMTMTESTATVAVTSDDPAAREARLEAPLASAGRGVGQLASQAVAGRLAAAVSGAAGANSLTIAGREFTGTEALAAEFLAGGYATGAREISADELLRQSGFNLTGDGDGRGFNFWGSGDFVSAEGDHDGVDYDGDTSAFTLGIDTGWKDGLVGVAVSRSDGDVDFTVKADNTEHTLETEVTSFHPYLTRRLNRSQLWLTAGHGSGDAEIKEPNDVVIKTDLTVTTAAFGITHARGDLFTGGISALYSRAKLDAVTTGRRLPATAADSLRIKADAETGWTHGAWRPFLSFALRHDSGDGDTGGAFDLGGGVEWQKATASLRLSGATHLAGDGAEEDRLTLTLRKNAGRLNLGLNLTAADGVDTGNLLSGELRF